MKNDIKELEIQNFKSIKHIKFNPKRVNVIIGKPNVGKSNLLEAMSLMSGLYTKSISSFFMDDHVLRCKDMFNLFYDEDIESNIEIHTDKASVFLFENNSLFNFFSMDKHWLTTFRKIGRQLSYFNLSWFFDEISKNTSAYSDFDDPEKPLKKTVNNIIPSSIIFQKKGNFVGCKDIDSLKFIDPIKRYSYKHFDKYDDTFRGFLISPFGDNLFSVLSHNKELLNEIGGFLEEQGLEFVLDKKENKFIIQKKIDRIVYQIPYSNIADTLKHIIFYLAAIETNKDSVLLFEEPEVHSYPPYVKMLADRIILSEENQFFITTHSPYMLNSFINDLKDEELNVVLAYYEDYQTKIKILSKEELREMVGWGVDVFFNIDRFLETPVMK